MNPGRGIAFGLAAALVGLLGCTSAFPKPGPMTAYYGSPLPGHDASVGIVVRGGSDQPPRMSDEAFAEALRASLGQAGLFSRVVAVERAEYRLDVVLGDLEHQLSDVATMSVLTALWSLSRVDGQETLWQEIVVSSHTASVRDALLAAGRLRNSVEGAARDNIVRALDSLSAAPLGA